MTRFMKLFLSLAAVSCHCGLAQELQVSYTTELQSDFKQGSNWVNLLRLNFTHSLSKHTILQAATISTARTRAESLADDFQTFSNIEEENHPLAFATLGIQQQFGHSSLFFGIRNLNEDYFTSPATSLFTNSSCGIFPTLSADYQIANYPVASVGLHYELQFTRWSLQASVYNGKGYYRFAGKENVFRFCPQQDGILSVTSLNYQHHDSNYHVGFALHSGMYMDYEEGTPEKTEKERRKNNLGICRATSCSRSACTPARFIPVWCLQRMQKLCRRRSHLAMWKNRRRTVHRLRPTFPFIRMGQ